MPAENQEARAILAVSLSLRGAHGWVYRDVDLDIPRGGLTSITGEAGTGRTSLLLTLAGRMRPTDGTLTVSGRTERRHIRRVAALGLVHGVNDLDDALSIREHVHERLGPRRPLPFAAALRALTLLGRRSGKARAGSWRHREEQIATTVLQEAGLDVSALPLADRTLVRDLGREQRLRLGIALALLDDPEVLLLDDVDSGLREEQRAGLVAVLRDLCERGITVVVTATEPLPGVGVAASLSRGPEAVASRPVPDAPPATPHDASVQPASVAQAAQETQKEQS